MSKSLVYVALFLAAILTLAGCGDNGSTTVNSTGCDSDGALLADQLGEEPSSDRSQVFIAAGTKVDNKGSEWCGSPQLTADVSPATNPAYLGCGSSSCSAQGALSEIDVQPDGLAFDDDLAELKYDISEDKGQPPKCREQDVACDFEIFQFIPGSPNLYTWVGDGVEIPDDLVKGDIEHFSVFALVEVPPEQPIAPVGRLPLTIASEFRSAPDDPNRITFAARLDDDQLGDVEAPELSALFVILVNPDPQFDPDIIADDTGCSFDDRQLAETLTCLFPVDTPVEASDGPGLDILSLDTGNEIIIDATLSVH